MNKQENASAQVCRAMFLLTKAARYIRANADTSATIFYDNAECDGECLADDMELIAEELEIILSRAAQSAA